MADDKPKVKKPRENKDGTRMSGSLVKPSLDHYIGRPVESIISYGKENWEWAVKLEGGTLIKNHDKRRKAKPDTALEATLFSRSIISELDTRMVFSDGSELVFTPTQYSISGMDFQGDREVFPQKPDEEEAILVPDDPSDKRISDGPSEEYLTMHQALAEEEALRLEAAQVEEDVDVTEMGGGSDDDDA